MAGPYGFIPSILASIGFWHFVVHRFTNTGYLIHAGASSLFALLSLSLFQEWWEMIVISSSVGYFIAHMLVMIAQKEFMYIIHHILALTLLFGTIIEPKFVIAKAASSILLTELSTPFLYLWEVQKTETSQMIFLFLFFLVRIIYLPLYLIKGTKELYSLRLLFGVEFVDIGKTGPYHVVLFILWLMNFIYFVHEIYSIVLTFGKHQNRHPPRPRTNSSRLRDFGGSGKALGNLSQ